MPCCGAGCRSTWCKLTMETKPDVSHPLVGPVEVPLAFEKRLDSNLGAALNGASRFLEGRGEVHTSLRRICQRLDELAVPYAVAGGMAVFAQGLRRVTEDVDLVVAPESLHTIHLELEGLGYVRLFTGSKNLRDV